MGERKTGKFFRLLAIGTQHLALGNSTAANAFDAVWLTAGLAQASFSKLLIRVAGRSTRFSSESPLKPLADQALESVSYNKEKGNQD